MLICLVTFIKYHCVRSLNVYICTVYLNEIRLDFEHVQSQIRALVATNPNKLNVLILNSIMSSLKNVWNQVQNNLIKVIKLQVI